MQNINFIKHLKGVFYQFSEDSRLNPTHISLYVALFQLWNNNRFVDEFYVNREEVMKLSKIGSKSTYHKCIKELSHWKYIIYYPSHNPYKGSKIKMFSFEKNSIKEEENNNTKNETSTGQALVHKSTKSGTSSGQALVPIYKHNKTYINKNNSKLDKPKNEKEVIDFFKKENWSEIDAQKFYNHYQGIGWKLGGKTKIVDWKATAKNWIIKAEEIKTQQTKKQLDQNMDNLKTTKNKNYDEPL